MRSLSTLVLLCAFAVGCGEMVDKSKAVAAMTSAGYTDVKVTDQHGISPSFYGCSDSDAVAFDVTATNPPASARIRPCVAAGASSRRRAAPSVTDRRTRLAPKQRFPGQGALQRS
jgi:hypothetical protein